jgi:hypothetical protein
VIETVRVDVPARIVVCAVRGVAETATPATRRDSWERRGNCMADSWR